MTTGEVPTSRPPKREAVDPFLLAELLQVEAVISLDHAMFKKKPRHVPNDDTNVEYYGYRPDSTTLWNTVKLETLVAMVDYSHKPYHVENLIAMATRKADNIVQGAVNALRNNRPDKFNGDIWGHIQSTRANRRGWFDGHQFHYE